MDVWDTIEAERLALADDLDRLTDAQWQVESGCTGWSIHVLAGHLVMPMNTKLPTLLWEMVKAKGDFDRVNDKLSREEAAKPPAVIVADLRANAKSRFHPPGFGAEAPLTDVLVHGRDIRLPLEVAEAGDPERWRTTLDLLVSTKGKRAFAPKAAMPAVRLVAKDIEWEHGAEAADRVEGSAADLAYALSGRRARLDALHGPGAVAFKAWVPG